MTVDPYLFWGAKYQIEQVWEGGSQDGLEVEPVGIAVIADPGFGQAQAKIDMFESFKADADGRLDIAAPITDRQGLLLTLAGPPSRHFYYFFCHGYAPVSKPVMRRDGVKFLRESIEALPSPERKPWNSLLALTANMAATPGLPGSLYRAADKKMRDDLLKSLNLGDAAVIGAVVPALITLGASAAIAAPVAPFLVKKFIMPAKDELCDAWGEAITI